MKRVLIVEDEKIIREGISKVIQWNENGFDLIGSAKDGIQALDMIKELKPNIVITDIKIPCINGIQLIKKVKEEGISTKFVLLSGYNDLEYKEQAKKLGVNHYLTKPTNEEEILKVMASIKKEL